VTGQMPLTDDGLRRPVRPFGSDGPSCIVFGMNLRVAGEGHG